MQLYSEIQIKTLHTEFRGHKKYGDKLLFFDRIFGVIPFYFPDFDPQLPYFFQIEKTNELFETFKKERNNPALTEKKFYFGESFSFNIKPANSNSSVYSNFILSSFLSRKPNFGDWICLRKTGGNTVEFLLDEANAVINKVEYLLQNEYDKSFRLQCMSVFYKGFYDAFRNRVNLPDKKRKFTELYLYAQGIIYAEYVNVLKRDLQHTGYPADSAGTPAELDLEGKLDLLNTLGIIDFLKSRFAGLDSYSCEHKMAEILYQITGESGFIKNSLNGIRASAPINRFQGNK
jgi:hypothetical protein